MTNNCCSGDVVRTRFGAVIKYIPEPVIVGFTAGIGVIIFVGQWPGFLGLVPMQMLAHEVESLLDLARNHQLRLTAPIVTEILRSRDALQAQVQQVSVALETGRLPSEIIPVSHLISAVKRLAAGTPADSRPAPVEAAPVAPVGPVAPVAPVGPATVEAAPVGPVAPVSPLTPCGPWAPTAPV